MKLTRPFASAILAGILLAPVSREGLYLDPGSGSFILQLIVAGAAGAVYMLRSYITRFFNRLRGKQVEEDEDSSSDNG